MNKNNTFYSMHKSNTRGTLAKIIIYLFFAIILLALLISIIGIRVTVPEISIDNIENIPPPIQIPTNETEMIERFEIRKVASFELTGRILAHREYNEYKVGYSSIDAISPIDMCIGWRKLSTSKNDYAVEFYELTDRYVNYTIKNTNVLSPIEVTTSISNTHLIPKTNKIKKQLATFQKGDLIRIKGYLVEVYDTTGQFLPWKTSTVRTDTGGGACEIILVEEVYRVVKSDE